MTRRDRGLIAVAAIACGALFFRARHYLPFFSDDAFISLRYAHRLLEGHGLNWNDGERVEGYSNLLWILLIAGMGRFGVELVLAARVLGMLLTMATLCAFVAAFRRSRASVVIVGAVAIALASTNTLAVWAIGGLEQPLLACLLTVSIALLLPWDGNEEPRVKIAGVLLGLLVLTRPDGALLSITVAVAWWIPRPSRIRELAWLLAPAAVCFVGQTAFRLAYYGDWLPNTGRAKLQITREHVERGITYLRVSLRDLWPFFAAFPLIVLLVRGPASRQRQLLLLVPALAWLAYTIAVGGDFFPAHRQYMPLLLLSAFCVVEVFDFFYPRPGIAGEVALVSIAVWLGCVGYRQSRDHEGTRAMDERWEWDGQAVGLFLKQAFGRVSPTIAVDAAGSVPYYSELPSIDLLGLNDRWLATHPRPNSGHGIPGHELGNGTYALSRHPDLYMSHIPPGMDFFQWPGDKELDASPEFHRDYRFLHFRVEGAHPVIARLWVRWTSPLIGVQRESNRVTVPGMFLARGHLTLASLDDSGALSTDLPPGRTSRLTGLSLPRGHWRITADATGPVEIMVPALSSAAVTQIDIPEDASDLEVDVRATQGETHVRSIDFTQVAPP